MAHVCDRIVTFDSTLVDVFCLDVKAPGHDVFPSVSWTDIFPVFDDEAFSGFQKEATEDEHAELHRLFNIARVYNPKPAKHIVSTSLFWKASDGIDASSPLPSRDLLENPAAHGIFPRIGNPWRHYVEPIFEGARNISELRPDIAFRVYLANDMAFVIPELVEAGCEVFLMESSSIGMQPGMMWRFLALEHDGLVTVTDSDRARKVIHDIKRTEMTSEGGLSHWRLAYTVGREATRRALPTHYRPIVACHFGSATRYPMKDLMMGFIWSHLRDRISAHVTLGANVAMPIWGSEWPKYGFDEWFLQAALYPRMAFNGILSFVPWDDQDLNQWFALDIEYLAWANSKSEILYFDRKEEAVGSKVSCECCQH